MKNLTIPTIALLICLFASQSHAVTPAGRIAFGLDMPFLKYTGYTIEQGSAKTEFDTFQIGLAGQEVGLWGGFTIIDHLTVGARLALAFDRSEVANNETKTFNMTLFPFAEYAFDLGMVSPFIAAGLGFRVDREEFSDNPTVTNKISQFLFGGGGGVHIFLIDALSIDTSLMLTGGVGGGETEASGNNFSSTADLDARSFQLQVLVGISGWI